MDHRHIWRITSNIVAIASTADQRGRPARQTSAADQHGRPARQTSTADQHGRPARQTSAADQRGRPARQTSRWLLKTPVNGVRWTLVCSRDARDFGPRRRGRSMPRRLPRSLRAPKRPPSELQEGPRRPEHFVMEDTVPKSGLEPRREVLVVASAAARFAGLQAEEGLPYQGPVHCPREAGIGDREAAASLREDRFGFQENVQGSRRQ